MKAHRQKLEKKKEGDTDEETRSNFDFRGWLSPLLSPNVNYRGFRAAKKASPGSNQKKQQITTTRNTAQKKGWTADGFDMGGLSQFKSRQQAHNENAKDRYMRRTVQYFNDHINSFYVSHEEAG